MPTLVESHIGPGRDYENISAWWNAVPDSLTAENELHRGVLHREGPGNNGEWTLSDIFSFDGKTMDSTRYAELVGAEEDWNWGSVPLWYDPSRAPTIVSTNNGSAIRMARYSRIRRLQVKYDGGFSSGNEGIISRSDGRNTFAEQVLLFLENNSGSHSGHCCNVRQITLRNALLIIGPNAGGNTRHIQVFNWSGSQGNVYENVTCVRHTEAGSNSGIEVDTTNATFRNVVSAGNSTDWILNNTPGTAEACASGDATAPGSSPITNLNLGETFVDPDSDLRLASGSSLINAGVDTSPGVTEDFVGTSRPQDTDYDIGAHEFTEAAGTAPVISSAQVEGVTTDGFTLKCTTDTGEGVMYAVAYDSALDTPSDQQIADGQNVNSEPAEDAVSTTVTSDGEVTLPAFSGLDSGTTYGWAIVHGVSS